MHTEWRHILAWISILACAAMGQPNIVLIVSDDAAYNEIGYTGFNEFDTPNIDSIAASGIRFTQAYATQPVCGPSRAALLLGIHQQRVGFESNVPRTLGTPEGLRPGQVTMAHRFKCLGYTTAGIGKWHLGSKAGWNRPRDLGFDEFFGLLGGARSYWAGETDGRTRILRQGVDVEDVWPTQGDPSLYDPVHGRYLTDAFGEEAVDFINRHADDPNPFFLYLAFTAPHVPLEAKASDLDRFPHLSGDQRLRAAMTFAMDRSIGWVIDALQDHDLEQETIIVFVNDNGGPTDADNSPFTGGKGSAWEGGLRVAWCMRWPGMPQNVEFDRPVSLVDVLPTLVAAAGGQVSGSDGADLAPYLSGDEEGDPHEYVFVRNRWEWAIRSGAWKLVRPDSGLREIYLFNVEDDPGETTDLRSAYPDRVDAMIRAFTAWEATLDKLRWLEAGGVPLNQFDHFRSRLPADNFNWSNEDVWLREDSQTVVNLERHDCYADLTLEFPTRAGDYVARSTLPRVTSLACMLNRFRFTSATGADGPYTGSLTGNPVVMVPGLDGAAPEISLEADADEFGFRVQIPIEFLGDLSLAGGGSARLSIESPVTEYLPGQSVRKAGACTIDVYAPIRCSGAIEIAEGELALHGSNAELASLSLARIGPAGMLSLASDAIVAAPRVELAGRLGGQGFLRVAGDYLTTSPDAVLRVTLAGRAPGWEHDALQVSGAATLRGALEVDVDPSFMPDPDDAFRVVQAAARFGRFTSVRVSPPRWRPRVTYDTSGATLRLVCLADLDTNGLVDSRDFLDYLSMWTEGESMADWNTDDRVDTRDFLAYLNDWHACRS